jgi:4-hydroxy-3-methylbut-2-enyl diphosphate reductase IspH
MRVAIIGGLERHEAEIERRASELGHTVEFHRGCVGGRRAEALVVMVSRCDVAIIVTKVNSHGAMHLAKKAASRSARPTLLTRTCSPSSFWGILQLLALKSPGASTGAEASTGSPKARRPDGRLCPSL